MFDAFIRKLTMVILAGLVAASLLWGFKHIVNQALWESGDGWREIYKATPAPRR